MRVGKHTSGSPLAAAAAGAVLALVGALAAVYAVRAGYAQCLYRRGKAAAAAGDVAKVLSLCRRAYAAYPHNYYFLILAAEQAYYSAGRVVGGKSRDRLRLARLWCERGLVENRRKSQLRRLMARFRCEESPAAGLAYWKEYTDWHFWEPHNHAVLAELYAATGNFEAAYEELYWARRAAGYEETRAAVERAEDQRDAEWLRRIAEEWGE